MPRAPNGAEPLWISYCQAMTRADLFVFAKQPVLGRTKTRLAVDIGQAAALAFYSLTLSSVLMRLANHPRWKTHAAVTPDGAVDVPAFAVAGVTVVPQGAGDLGQRMMRRLAAATSDRPVMIVGSDIPDLEAGHVEAALDALATDELTIGPSPDGGYWLIGASRPVPPNLFEAVRWSSPYARSDTLANAADLSVRSLALLEDVDDGASYRRWVTRQACG